MKYFVILSLCAATVFGFEIPNYKRTPQGDSVDKASMKILKEAFASAEDKNVIASPLGALTLLSMYSAGAEGENRQEIMRLLGASDYKQLEESYGSLTERFSAMDPSFLVLANKLYVSDKYTLDDQFSDVASRSYKSEVEQVDWTQKKSAVDNINKWANEKTKGHIPSPVDEESIDEDMILALFNVIFFQGHWHIRFNASETEEKDFYVDDNTVVKKPMMKYSGSLYYHEDPEIKARLVELPYKEKGFRMVVVLPDEKDGLPAVLDKLEQRGMLEDVFALRPSGRVVHLEMPKFEIESSLDLTDILPKVGVSRMFSEGASGVVREGAVAVSKAFQEAFVKVDEEGASAGAFTGAFVWNRSYISPPPRPIQFKVDHPFLFSILHEDIVLFTGTYTH